MKKTIIIQSLILILFFILFYHKFWIEEILLLYFSPIFISFIILGIIKLIILIFKKSKFSKYIINSFLISAGLQVLLLILILWSLYPRKFSKDQVIKDIEFAKVLMEDVHPDLYAVLEKDKLDFIIDSVESTIPKSLSEVDVYKVLNSIYSNVKDAHTKVTLNNYLKRGAVLFRKVPPYRFKIIDSKMFVLKNYYLRNNIPVGSEIIKINGKSVSVCLDEISKLVSYETTNNLNAMLQLPILWGLWNNFREFEIIYKTPENKVASITTSSGLIANISFLYDFTGFFIKNYSFHIINENIGYINIKAFMNLDKFKEFLNSTFSKIKQKNIDNIIIDLRENSGGNTDLSEELMQYISPVSFRSFDTSYFKVSEELIRAYSFLKDTSKYKSGSIRVYPKELIPLRENELRFKGKSYILTSAYTFSTALDFTAMIRCFKVGKIIGSETGGRTVSFGSPHNFLLPETGIEMKVSCKKFINACGVESKRGLIPDQVIENSIQDDINGIDKALEFIITEIKEEQK